jgi:hypothetical protein
MSKIYVEPEAQVRLYSANDLVYTVSTPEVGGGSETPDLGDEDLYNPFG